MIHSFIPYSPTACLKPALKKSVQLTKVLVVQIKQIDWEFYYQHSLLNSQTLTTCISELLVRALPP